MNGLRKTTPETAPFDPSRLAAVAAWRALYSLPPSPAVALSNVIAAFGAATLRRRVAR